MLGWLKSRSLVRKIRELEGDIALELRLKKHEVDLKPLGQYGRVGLYGFTPVTYIECDKENAIRLVRDFYNQRKNKLSAAIKKINIYQPTYYYPMIC